MPIKNLISSGNESRRPQLLGCEVCVKQRPLFHRGDCNLSRRGRRSVEVADAAAVLGFLFGTDDRRFDASCLDACDCNDDGVLDLADSMCLLRFLFQSGPFPPAPGPGFGPDGSELPPGEDPTEDSLGCEAGGECV